jgi:hypothetical protein
MAEYTIKKNFPKSADHSAHECYRCQESSLMIGIYPNRKANSITLRTFGFAQQLLKRFSAGSTVASKERGLIELPGTT